MNVFNQKEFDELCKKFSTCGNIEDVSISYANSGFFNKVKASVQRDRRGEVVFCVIRPGGKIITVTCSEYPEGIFRIPTGGIGHREDITGAVYREVKEELGLDVEVVEFAGVIKLRFEHEGDQFMFYSYLFLLEEKGGRLLLDASDDEVSEVREVDTEGLAEIVEALAGIKGKWSDWGRFRYATSNAVLQMLRKRKQP